MRGGTYCIDPKSPAICEMCGSDVTELIRDIVMIYMGKLDGLDFFLYDNPFECPTCHRVFRYHLEKGGAPMDVTKEFENLTKKN